MPHIYAVHSFEYCNHGMSSASDRIPDLFPEPGLSQQRSTIER